MLPRKYFSITYPEVTPKYTNLYKCVHDQLIVNMPSIDIDKKSGLIYPESINIHMLAERFLHLPFKGLLDLENIKRYNTLSLDFVNTIDEPGTIYAEKFTGAKEAFNSPETANFIAMRPGDRIYIPQEAIKVEQRPIRDCSVRSLAILSKAEIGPSSFSQEFYTIGAVTPKEIHEAILKKNEEILKELETLFKSKEFREKLAVNDKTCYLEGKYFPQLNVIADVDTNLFPKLNTSADFDSNQYIVMKIASLDTVQESIDTVRVNFAKLSFSLEK